MAPGKVAFSWTTLTAAATRAAALVSQHQDERHAELGYRVFDAALGGQVDGIAGDTDYESLAQAAAEQELRWNAAV